MPPEVSATFPRCSHGRHGAGVMNGKPACQMLLPSSVLSRRLEHKIKHTNDREKRKEDTWRKTKPLNNRRFISFGVSSCSECVTGFSIININDLSYKTQTHSFLTVLRRNVPYITRTLKYPEHWRGKFWMSWDKCTCLSYTFLLSLWIVRKVMEWQ
jgi:hypothetical protein